MHTRVRTRCNTKHSQEDLRDYRARPNDKVLRFAAPCHLPEAALAHRSGDPSAFTRPLLFYILLRSATIAPKRARGLALSMRTVGMSPNQL